MVPSLRLSLGFSRQAPQLPFLVARFSHTAPVHQAFRSACRVMTPVLRAITLAGRTSSPGLTLSDVSHHRVPRFHRLGRNSNLPT